MTDKEIDNEQIEQEKYREEEDEFHNKNYKEKKDKSLSEIETIQKSIQEISKKIEEDKINLRILQERHIKKQSEYNQLAGKPIIKSKEQKMEEMKEKMQKLKNRQIFDPNYGKKNPILQPGEETKMIQKNTDKCKIEYDNLINAINKQVLYNNELQREIEEVRKEKNRIHEKIEKADEQNKSIEEELEIMQNKNNAKYKKIQFKELNKVREKGKVIESQFLEERDILENRFHKVIEANIRREKEHKNDLRKIRLKNAIFADRARAKGSSKSMADINDLKLEDQDEIHDRMPILDMLIDKWKYITKYKRNMLDKYIKYANEIRISFDKLLEYLGLEKLEKLPEVYTKNEQQMSSIESYLSSLSSEVDNLSEQKSLLEKQIIILSQTKKDDKEEQLNLIEERKEKIALLQKYNDELVENINRKKVIFKDLEEPTFNFLNKMQKTYLTDFVVSKNSVDKNTRLNENNVINYLGTVYCYCQLINDFDENVNYNQSLKVEENNDVNKTIDLLKKDIKTKLSKFNYKNCVKGDIHNSINNTVKHGDDFDETIRRLANVIVDQVNNNGDYSLNNISSMNTNNASY
jgi:hypothetical protein